MKSHPEIESLKQYFCNYSIKVERVSSEEVGESFWIHLTINTQSWNIYIDDEYKDFDENKQLLSFYITLCALEAYKQSPDFLAWAKEQDINASESKWLAYYHALETICREIEALTGHLDTYVSYFDYSMRTELGLALRNYKG